MKINKVKTDILCESIHNLIKQRKNIRQKIIVLQTQLEEQTNKLKELDKDFRELKIDIDLYKLFFQLYDIDLGGDIYHVDKIQLVTSCDETFWDVIYTFYSGNTSHTGSVSLRKYIHILDNVGAKLIINKRLS